VYYQSARVRKAANKVISVDAYAFNYSFVGTPNVAIPMDIAYMAPANPAAPANKAVAGQPRPLLFVHVPKTGGESISAGLGLEPGHKTTVECMSIPTIEQRHPKHMPASEARDYYTATEWAGAFVFAFVRNPLDLMVSLHAFFMGILQHTVEDWETAISTVSLMANKCGCAEDNPAAKLVYGKDPSMHPPLADLVNCSFSFWMRECMDAGCTRRNRAEL
jgi:hypothetical protein